MGCSTHDGFEKYSLYSAGHEWCWVKPDATGKSWGETKNLKPIEVGNTE